MRKWWRYAEVYMVYGEHRNKIWWNLGGDVEVVQTFCRSRKFRARWRVRGPEVPGKAGRSGGRNVRAGPEVPVVGILPRTETWGSWIWAEKLGEKPKSEGEKEEIGGKEGGVARSTSHTQTSWIKTNKISTHEQIIKKNWGYFWWGFSD